MRHNVFLFSLTLLCCISRADSSTEWDGDYAAARARYMIYSGSLSEKERPKAANNKVSLLIEGQLAKELFNAIGPDQKQACGASTGVRIRERGDVTCSFDRGLKSSPYTCFVGLDLKTGKSMEGAIC